MFDKYLSRYRNNGFFIFNFSKSYREACNAPDNLSGVYLIFQVVNGREILVYIGSSGQRSKQGLIKHRKGGIKDRLINGYHPYKFGQAKRIKRYIALPQQMIQEGIPEIKIYWWVTYDIEYQDFPTDVETLVEQDYRLKYKCKPAWHR